MQVLISNAPSQATETLVSLNINELSYIETRQNPMDGRTLETRRCMFEVIGARLAGENVEISVRLNLTAAGLAEAYADGRQKWAKGHFLVSPDMSGFATLQKYAEKTVGRMFKGGALQFETGSGLNYYLMPVLQEAGYITFDLLQSDNVVIDGQESEQYIIADIWFDGANFVAPIGELEVQRPVKRANPLASHTVGGVTPAAPSVARRPVAVPPALARAK